MSARAYDMAELRRRMQVLSDFGGNKTKAAEHIGITTSTMCHVFREYKKRVGVEPLEAVGYTISADPADRTPAEAWATHASAVERAVAKSITAQWKTINRPKGAFVVFHSTDEHIDDDATPLYLIEADVKAAKAMNAVRCHGGDLLNNWPLAGRLAKQWAEQECTMSDGLLRAKHFIEIFTPEVWTNGNHEEMNPYLADMLAGWLPTRCLKDFWTCNFQVDTPGGRAIRVSLSHKFQKGSSWFHPHHGALRESMEAEPADLYLEGHLHISGVIHRTLPERGMSMTAVSSAGYKIIDKYGARISRGGKIPKIKGRAHWVVCDPYSDDNAMACVAFDEPRQAEMYFGALQNLRAV